MIKHILLWCLICRVAHSEHALLRFMILADWGKGGSTGTYGSVMEEPKSSSHGSLRSNAENNKDNNNNKDQRNGNNGGGGGGGGGGGKKGKTINQLAVAKAMNQFASTSDPHPEFILALGDNFYDNGVKSSSDQLWDYLWKDVYINPYDSLYIPWYVSPGNHDYMGSVQAQLDRSKEHLDDDIWMMPSTNYTRIFTVTTDTEEVNVAIIFVDTQTLAPSANACCNENGGISKTEQSRRIVNQLEHLQSYFQSLEKSETLIDWILVVGHYPVFSAGDHCDNSELITYLKPFLDHYPVTAYISGHDHISEHLTDPDNANLHYFVAGAGAMQDSLNSKCTSRGNLVWSGTGYSAFAYMDVTKTTMSIHYIDTNNEEKYAYTMTNNRYTKRPSQSPTFLPNENDSVPPTPFPSIVPSMMPTEVNPLPPPLPPKIDPVPSFAPTILPPEDADGVGSGGDTSTSNGPAMTPAKVAYISLASIAAIAILIAFFYRFVDWKVPAAIASTEQSKKSPAGGKKTNSPGKRGSPGRSPSSSKSSPHRQQQQQQQTKRILKNYVKFRTEPNEDDDETPPPPLPPGVMMMAMQSSSNKKNPLVRGKKQQQQQQHRNYSHLRNDDDVEEEEEETPEPERKIDRQEPGGPSELSSSTMTSSSSVDDSNLPAGQRSTSGAHVHDQSFQGKSPLFPSIHSPGHQPIVHRRSFTTSL